MEEPNGTWNADILGVSKHRNYEHWRPCHRTILRGAIIPLHDIKPGLPTILRFEDACHCVAIDLIAVLL